jgi:hypothetical protein
MDYDFDCGRDDMYLILIVSTCAIDYFFLSVEDSGQIEDVDGIDGPPWTQDRVKEWTIYGLNIYVIAYVTYDWYIMMIVYISVTCSLMDAG